MAGVTCKSCKLPPERPVSGKAAPVLASTHDRLIHGGKPTAEVTR